MDIEPTPRLAHSESGQNGGTGPANSATDKELVADNMIVVPRNEYHALQAELAQFKSQPNFLDNLKGRLTEPFKGKRILKALASGAMYVGTWIITPGSVAVGGYMVGEVSSQNQIDQVRTAYPDFDYVSMERHPEQKAYFRQIRNSNRHINELSVAATVLGAWVATVGVLYGVRRIVPETYQFTKRAVRGLNFSS